MNEKSIYELFRNIAESAPEGIAHRYKNTATGEWIPVSWREHQEACKRVSKGLLALGVKKEAKVNILSQTRLEWVQCDLGAVSIGAVTVGIYPSNLAPDCAYVINHSDADVVFVENQEQLNKILAVRKELKKLRHIILFDGEPQGAADVLTWQAFLDKGNEVPDADFIKRTEDLKPDDLASVVYTSGTTGVPKGAMLSHGNLVFTSWSAAECLEIKPGFETLLFLPLAHVFARIIVYFCLRTKTTVSFAESIEKVGDNLKEIKPQFFASVPRIYEKVYEKITTDAEKAGGAKAKIFKWALGVGYQASRRLQAKQPVTGLLAIKRAIADRLVFSKIKAALGSNIAWTISGAAPLNPAIAEFFHACDILILEGIGMTENTSFTNVNRVDNYKFGTVGLPGPEIEQKIGEDGEVLYRGRNIMLGYYKNAEATAETIEPDGWQHTGDIGEIDSDGFLKITDRKKDLIITAGGKNIAPQRVEKIMRTSRYISQIVVYGDKKKYLTAVVTLERPQVETWAVENNVEYGSWDELSRHPKVKALIEKEIEARNADLASFETIKKVHIAPSDFSIEAGELTPTLKIKRKVVTDKYRDKLEQLYAE